MNIALNIAFRLSCIIISAFLYGNVYQGQRTGSLYSGYVKVNKAADPIGFWLGYCVSLVGSAAVFAAAIIGPKIIARQGYIDFAHIEYGNGPLRVASPFERLSLNSPSDGG